MKGLVTGIEATGRELENVFQRHGIARIEAMGEKLDPHLHQAMIEVPSDEAEPGTIVQEMQAGYTIKDRLLRPALVGVARRSPERYRAAAPVPIAKARVRAAARTMRILLTARPISTGVQLAPPSRVSKPEVEVPAQPQRSSTKPMPNSRTRASSTRGSSRQVAPPSSVFTITRRLAPLVILDGRVADAARREVHLPAFSKRRVER